jgi:hypothetical protein
MSWYFPFGAAGIFRQVPYRPIRESQRDYLSRACVEPACFAGAEFELDGDVTADLLTFKVFMIATPRAHRQIR